MRKKSSSRKTKGRTRTRTGLVWGAMVRLHAFDPHVAVHQHFQKIARQPVPRVAAVFWGCFERIKQEGALRIYWPKRGLTLIFVVKMALVKQTRL
jgi:hypothetical protein